MRLTPTDVARGTVDLAHESLTTIMTTLQTDKQRIEQEFHDRWAKGIDLDSLLVREAFEACTEMENRFAFESL